MRKVLIYGPKDPVGGVEKIVLEYVKSIMKAHSDISFDFLVYGKDFSLQSEIENMGCRVLYLPSRKKNYFNYKKAVKNIFSKNSYIAVWGNYSGLTNIDLLVLAEKHGIPVRIAHSHSSKFYWGSPVMKYIVPTLHYFNEARITKYATDYWACSDVAADFMFPNSIKDKVEIINNAVDTEVFYPDLNIRKKVREELNIGEDAIVIGHVARMCEVKNQAFLLKVFAQIVKLNKKAKLLFVGDGELRSEIEGYINDLKIKENVILTGQRNDVSDLLRAMDLFMLTSFAEGLSVSAVEAQSCGLPCILPDSISKSTDICGFVKFISLDKGAAYWAEQTLDFLNTDTKNATERIRENGFDISRASEILYNRFINNK